MTELIGQRLANKYDIQGEIGRGGMGIVYRAFDLMLERPVAVKILPIEMTFDQQFVARFRKEAVTAASLHHANIVTIHDVGQQERIHYIVMQLLDGRTLDQWLGHWGPMPLPQANHLVQQMGDALEYAHRRGIIHRDIKPSNIMLDAEGHATLMDFGLVRAGEGTGLTRSGMVVGTPEYMAPEQALGKEVDRRSDIYSLGVVVYRTLCGQPPFVRSSSMATVYAHVHEAPPPLRQMRPDLPKAVEAAVLKALAKDPADRFQEAGQFVQELVRASAGKSSTSAPGLAAFKGPAAASSPAKGVPVVKSGKSGPRQAAPEPAPPAQTSAPTQIMGAATAAPIAKPAVEPDRVVKETNKPVPPVRPAAERRLPIPYLIGGVAALLLLLAAYFTFGPPTPPKATATIAVAFPGATTETPITATATLTPTFTDTATPAETWTPTETWTPIATDTQTPTETWTPTHTPTNTPSHTPTPTLVRTPTATPTPSPAPSPTPPQKLTLAPVLVAPAPGASVQIGSAVEFVWQYDGQLAENQGFEVRVWKENQPAHYGAAPPVRTTRALLDLSGAYGVQLGGSGRHLWTVAVVQIEPYQALGPEAPPQVIEIEGAVQPPRQ